MRSFGIFTYKIYLSDLTDILSGILEEAARVVDVKLGTRVKRSVGNQSLPRVIEIEIMFYILKAGRGRFWEELFL